MGCIVRPRHNKQNCAPGSWERGSLEEPLGFQTLRSWNDPEGDGDLLQNPESPMLILSTHWPVWQGGAEAEAQTAAGIRGPGSASCAWRTHEHLSSAPQKEGSRWCVTLVVPTCRRLRASRIAMNLSPAWATWCVQREPELHGRNQSQTNRTAADRWPRGVSM